MTIQEPGGQPSPLAVFLGGRERPPPTEDRALIEAISACMAQAGFVYSTYDPQRQARPVTVYRDGLSPGTVAWHAIYGFGISTTVLPQDVVGPDLVGQVVATTGDEANPNDRYIAQLELTDPRQAERYRAQVTRCEEAAVATAQAAEPPAATDVRAALGAAYHRAVIAPALDDPRYTAWQADVGACLARHRVAGIRSLEAAQDHLHARVEPYTGLRSLTSAQRSALRDLQVEEVALASAFIACGVMPHEDPPILLEILRHNEQRFVDANPSLIREAVARITTAAGPG